MQAEAPHHVCSAQGFGLDADDVCLACEARKLRPLSRAECIEVDKATGITPLRVCRDASCTLPHEHEAHDKQYDIRARLEKVASILGERGSSRDMPKGERSMARAVRIFNAASGRDLSAAEGWLFMIALKLSRRQAGKYKEDDYDDLVGYSVLFAEESAQEHEARKQTQ